MDAEKLIIQFLKRYKWTIILAIATLIFAICVISFGFFKSLFLFACVAVGVYGGWTLDKKVAKKRSSEENTWYD